jgi:hypothetical protein
MIFYQGSSSVTWQSQKQKIIMVSSCKAEYIMGMAAYQGVWLAHLLAELKSEWCTTYLLKMDSQSAIALSKNLVFHDLSKHIDARFDFIQERNGDGKMDTEHVRTEEQIANILRKPLARERFCELCEKLAVVRIIGNYKIRG